MHSKYQHYGHLFQDRYKSEPVNDAAYFFTLLRYIHQNPLAAGLVKRVCDYERITGGQECCVIGSYLMVSK